MLRAGEDEDRPLVLFEKFLEQLRFLFATDDEELLLNFIDGRPLRRNFDAQRNLHVGGSKLENFRRHRRGEEHRLSFFGNMLQDSLNLGLKTHIEHLIGFIENKDLHFAERDGPLLQVIIEATGRCNEDPRIPPKHLFLEVHGRPTNEDCGPDVKCRSETGERFLDLVRKFTCGNDN